MDDKLHRFHAMHPKDQHTINANKTERTERIMALLEKHGWLNEIQPRQGPEYKNGKWYVNEHSFTKEEESQMARAYIHTGCTIQESIAMFLGCRPEEVVRTGKPAPRKGYSS